MLSIDCISEIQFDEDAFKNLVLPENQKELIRVLVDNHTSQTSTFDDFITGKGRLGYQSVAASLADDSRSWADLGPTRTCWYWKNNDGRECGRTHETPALYLHIR